MSDGKIYAAISGVMADVGAVGKNKTNQKQNYKFRGIDDVMNALYPAMNKNKVFVAPTVLEQTREERTTANGGVLIYSIVKVNYKFYTDDGSYVESVVMGEAMDSGDKSMNKAMSAAFKYACFQTFCIPTEEMQDADKESPEPAPRNRQTEQQTEQQVKQQTKQQPAYPPRKEMMPVIYEKYPRGSKPYAALIAAFAVDDIENATDEQIQAAYNKVIRKK